ncbi:hypothetical protein [Aquiflexum lacus]|uniref:hypothetical protein n=1 Tax=Aquiflexum lacus TaxID=2483805 RepID=UPI001894DC97|nr:hypothetical protein [Aquiflexum lacus]
MSHESTEVYNYLVYLKKYLFGDLELFRGLARNAEAEELRIRETSIETHVIPTTQSPNSFLFTFGTPLISRCTIPHASVLFSTIDILGFLIRTEPNYKRTTKNFKNFFESLSPPITENELSVLIEVYRHGITHSYFPKLGLEISYHSTNPTERIIFKNELGDLVLNINVLETIVTERLSELINKSELYNNMDNQYRILVEGYENGCRTIINLLKSRLQNSEL